MSADLDPRVWNLFTGVALLTAGCGSRVAGSEVGETAETVDSVDTTPEGSECNTSADCPAFYDCYDGVCMYYPHHDGWVPYYDCYSDGECADFEICEFGYCELLDSPPANCTDQGIALPVPVPVAVDGEVLALTFADVDADGRDELVLATQAELLVLDVDGMMPVVNNREPGSLDDMVAGSFDAAPGDDVILLVDESLMLYGSNGDGSFAAPSTSLPPIGFVARLLAADLDGQPPTDLIGWGGLGAFVDRSGEALVISEQQYDEGAMHQFGAVAPGFALRRGDELDFFELDGTMLGVTQVQSGPSAIAAFAHGTDAEYVNLVTHAGWTYVETHSPTGPGQGWSIYGQQQQVFAADLHGDEGDELVYFLGSNVALELDPGGIADCWHELPLPTRGVPRQAVVGDHDGDGDEELAIRTELGEVVLFDGE